MVTGPGRHPLGPHNGTLTVRTQRTGAAAKAGHNLVIDVTVWQALVEARDDVANLKIELTADPTSLRVREGSGGMQALGDDDKANIEQTIRDEVLRGQAIEFRSTSVQRGDDGVLAVQGDLTLAGTTHPVTVALTMGAGDRLGAQAVVKQTDWGITPYSTLFGALKVADDVEIQIDAAIPSASA